MSENFSIYNPVEETEAVKFQKDTLGPITLDGTLSAVEINELNENFSDSCKSVSDETGGKLGDFLRNDVIPNMDSAGLDPYVKERISFLSLTHPEAANSMGLSPETQDYFQMSEGDSSVLEENLQHLLELGLDLNQFLEGLQEYIDDKLSFLGPESKSKICKSIGIKTLLLGDTIADMDLEDFSGEELLNQRWIINSKVQESYNFYTRELFPTLELKNKLDNGESIPTEYTQRRARQRGPGYMSSINHSMREVDELMNAEVDENGDFNEGWIQTQQLLNSGNYEDMLSDMGVESSENISMLSEEDQKTESIASLGEMCLVGISCLPYIGAIPSVLMDANDLMGRQPIAINALKSSEVLDSGYQIENTWLTKLTAGASLLLTPTGMQGFAKAGKLARSASKINNLDINTINKVIDVITEKLGFGDEIKEKLLSILGFKGSSSSRGINSNFGENRADSDFMTRAESNGNLSDSANTGRFDVQGSTMQMTQREEAFLVRLEGAYEAGETDLNINNLEAENIQVLLGILNKMHLEHGDIVVGQHTSSQIADKLRIARNAGMDRDIYKIAIREGYAGITDTYAGARDIIDSKEAASLSAAEIFEKIGVSLPDSIDLFDLEEALSIGDEKLIKFVQDPDILGTKINESNISKKDLLSAIRASDAIPEFDYLTADIASVINKLRDAGINLEIGDQRTLKSFLNIFKERAEMDLTNFMIAKNMFQGSGVQLTILTQILSEIGNIPKGTILRMIPESRRQAQKGHEGFAQYLAGRNGDDFDLSDIQAYLDSQSEIKTFNLSVGEESFEFFSGGSEKARIIGARFGQILQEHGSEFYVSTNL